MYRSLAAWLKKTPLGPALWRAKAFFSAGSQSDESAILQSLAVDCPRTFVEFGFHADQYNCIGLTGFAGLLIDGDPATVAWARRVLPRRIQVENIFLRRDDLQLIRGKFEQLGVLSIDIDGNDYWMAEALLPLQPAVLVLEYNASFGRRAVTVPYDSDFERHAKHPSGWYHGASLAALAKLAARSGYKLAAVSAGGQNAFFVPAARAGVPALDPDSAFRENLLRNQWSGKTAAEQWDAIKDLPLVDV